MKSIPKKWSGSGQDFYRETGSIMDALIARKSSLKNLVFNHPDVKNRKKMYALLCQVITSFDILDYLCKESDFYSVFPRGMALVIACESSGILDKKRRLSCGGKIKGFVNQRKAKLAGAVEKAKVLFDVASRKSQVIQLPKYIRINTNLLQSDDDLKELMTIKGIKADEHVKNLYKAPSKTNLQNHPLLLSKKIIVQDKSSCLSAAVLNPPADAIVLDACAAPGNKTTHLSALMDSGKGGLIRALEIDPKRFDILTKNVQSMDCENIKTYNMSFLDEKVLTDFADTEYVLLDPSCSGSGIVNQMERCKN